MTLNTRTQRPEFSPRSLLRAAWKQMRLGAMVAVAIGATGILATLHLTPIYQAEALILVDPQKIPERFVTSTVNSDIQERLATINQEVQSGTHLKKIIDEFNLYPKERLTRTPEELVLIMRKDTQTIFEKGVSGSRPGAFRIIYQAPDPEVAAKVVDRITNFYIEENYRSRELQAEGTYSFIENQLRDAKKNLDVQEQAVAQYKTQHNGELPQQEESLNSALARLQMELQGNQDALNRAQQNKLLLMGSLTAAEDTLASLTKPSAKMPERPPRVEASEDSDPVPSQRSDLPAPKGSQAIEVQLAALRLRYTPAHPEIKRLEALLEATRRSELAEPANAPATPGVPAIRRAAAPESSMARALDEASAPDATAIQRAQLNERITSFKSQIAATDREFQDRRADRERILRESASYQRRIEQLPVRDLEMASLTRNYDFSKTYYNSLLTKKTEAEMATDLEKRQKAETFRILDPARPPTKPVKPKKFLMFAASIVMGLVVGVCAGIAWELRTGVLLGEWEFPAGTVLLGRVPYIEPVAISEEDGNPGSGTRAHAAALHRFAGTISLVLSIGLAECWTSITRFGKCITIFLG